MSRARNESKFVILAFITEQEVVTITWDEQSENEMEGA